MKQEGRCTKPKHQDLRCKTCRTLLATTDGTGLTIVRGGLQATIDGRFHVSMVCYIPRCQSLNTFDFTTDRRGS